MTSEGDRELFQRAMVAASRGDVWWLARLLYGGLGQDPGHAGRDPRSQLRGRPVLRRRMRRLRLLPRRGLAGRARERLPGLRRRARPQRQRHGVRLLRRPAVRLLAGAAGPDPRPVAGPGRALPDGGARRHAGPGHAVPERPADRGARTSTAGTWLIYKPGGPHIIYGRGDACPDNLVTHILIKGNASRRADHGLPRRRRQRLRARAGCQRPGRGWHSNVMLAIDDEINAGVDYQYWDGTSPLAYGCPFGGTITYAEQRRVSAEAGPLRVLRRPPGDRQRRDRR